MSSSEMGALAGALKWGEEGVYVKEILAKGGLPQMAKIIKGSYNNIGVPSLANPSLISTLLLLSADKTLRVAAQCVKFKEGRRVVPVGPKLAIPENYDGYFEILSEDGKAVRCMETISELSKRFPDSCLVRETVKAYVSRSDDVDTITEKSRSVQVGETLILVGEVNGSKNSKNKQKYLRCFDQSGQNVYLPYDSKGKFSAIAKEDNISGVHTIKNLLNKRLPLMVRLIHGRPLVGSKSSQFLPELRLYGAFTDEALVALPLAKDSQVVFLPPSAPLKLALARNSENIVNTKEFSRLNERGKSMLQDLSERIYIYDINIGHKNENIFKDARFYHLPEQSKHRPKNFHSHHHHPPKVKSPPDKNISKVKEKTGEKLDDYDEIDQIYDYVRGFAPLPKNLKHQYALSNEPTTPSKVIGIKKSSEPVENRPTPPPVETIPSRKGDLRNVAQENFRQSIHPALISSVLEKAERKPEKTERKVDKDDGKIEKTEKVKEKKVKNVDKKNILSKQLSTGTTSVSTESKANNHSKLFIKASHQKSTKQSRIFRHKASSPVKETNIDNVINSPSNVFASSLSLSHLSKPGGIIPVTGNSQSPIFRSRYKSLTNLDLDFDTLNSSTSGGKNSADSCVSFTQKNKIIDKKNRKLPRPKSLTNLVWDGRETSLPSDGSIFNGLGTARALLEAERKLRLEPGVYRHTRDTPAVLAATTRLLASQRKIGTLYI